MIFQSTSKNQILGLIQEAKDNYREKLGCKGSTRHADPETLGYCFDDQKLSIELTYTRMDSPIGFPYNRMICKLRLNGTPISLKQLKDDLNEL